MDDAGQPLDLSELACAKAVFHLAHSQCTDRPLHHSTILYIRGKLRLKDKRKAKLIAANIGKVDTVAPKPKPEAHSCVFGNIKIFYNSHRHHNSLSCTSPRVYEKAQTCSLTFGEKGDKKGHGQLYLVPQVVSNWLKRPSPDAMVSIRSLGRRSWLVIVENGMPRTSGTHLFSQSASRSDLWQMARSPA